MSFILGFVLNLFYSFSPPNFTDILYLTPTFPSRNKKIYGGEIVLIYSFLLINLDINSIFIEYYFKWQYIRVERREYTRSWGR